MNIHSDRGEREKISVLLVLIGNSTVDSFLYNAVTMWIRCIAEEMRKDQWFDEIKYLKEEKTIVF